ncbi:histidinol-phosphatase HisJ family protein [Petrocella sp. FN5]|uniref:histidinol-phosphatase HisJ family protein n=1 Tax=Petrocella sp. FN5 TaxID=3032002 RepID=UPI0023DC894A|nr:histidinol-phosphatase HisJ family protein [Petrocella sp. FN5]MDF1616250.1 histidinol-phosphatase HisJ family protein [Petrocella sp. FN5]
MIRSDLHNHTYFSFDSQASMSDMIEAARKKGLSTMAFTDHHDIDFNYEGISGELDVLNYIKAIDEIRTGLTDDFNLLTGIEFGIEKHLHEPLRQLARRHAFDFIISSTHFAKGKDPYEPTYFDGLTRNEGYFSIFEDTLFNVQHFDDFDTLGHLDYVIRYWRRDDHKKYTYADFSDVLDAILTTLIRKDKALEVNTSGYVYKLDQPHPSYEVLKRYHQLGGELLTIGSDAHRPENVATSFDLVEKHLKDIGFKSYTQFQKRVPKQIGFN